MFFVELIFNISYEFTSEKHYWLAGPKGRALSSQRHPEEYPPMASKLPRHSASMHYPRDRLLELHLVAYVIHTCNQLQYCQVLTLEMDKHHRLVGITSIISFIPCILYSLGLLDATTQKSLYDHFMSFMLLSFIKVINNDKTS